MGRLLWLTLFLLLGETALAQGDNLFKDVTGPGANLFYELKPLLYGMAGLAVLGVGALTIFSGKVSWGWFFALIGALTIMFLIEPMVQWTTNTDLQRLQAGGGEKIFGDLEGKSDDLYNDAQAVIFAISGIAVVGLGALSLFGRFNWVWFGAIVGGLFIVNMAAQIVELMKDTPGI